MSKKGGEGGGAISNPKKIISNLRKLTHINEFFAMFFPKKHPNWWTRSPLTYIPLQLLGQRIWQSLLTCRASRRLTLKSSVGTTRMRRRNASCQAWEMGKTKQPFCVIGPLHCSNSGSVVYWSVQSVRGWDVIFQTSVWLLALVRTISFA